MLKLTEINAIINDSTVTQLILCACVARGLSVSRTLDYAKCSKAMLYKTKKDKDFSKIIKAMSQLPPDNDYPDGYKSIIGDVGRLIYNYGTIQDE